LFLFVFVFGITMAEDNPQKQNRLLYVAGLAAVVFIIGWAMWGFKTMCVLSVVGGGGFLYVRSKFSSSPAESKTNDKSTKQEDKKNEKKEKEKKHEEGRKHEEKVAEEKTRPKREKPQLHRTERSRLILGFKDGSVKLRDVLPEANASTLARRNAKAEKQATMGKSKAMEIQRNRVMNEVITTERAYVQFLATLREVFIEPLRAKKILDAQQMREVFGFIEIIEGINRTIVLEKMESWTPEGDLTPGQVFESFTCQAGYLSSYSSYINNFDDARDRVAKLLESKKSFASFIDDAQKNPRCNGLTLDAFLIMPVQRLPRYVLLINELLKATPEKSPDHKKLSKALEEMKRLTKSINEKKSEQEQRAMVRLVQNQMTGLTEDLMSVVSRRLLKEGTMSLIPDANAPVAYERHLRQIYLFDDLLIIAHASVDMRGRHRVETELALRDIHHTITESGSTKVLVIVCKSNEAKCFAFVAPTNQETQCWGDELQRSSEGFMRRMSSFH